MAWIPGFVIPHHPRLEALPPGRPLRLERARGLKLRCLAGCVWITAPHLTEDVFLHVGERWTVPNDGLVLVEAEGGAVVALDC